MAKAFRYGLSRRDAFSLFLTDGRVAIDNNLAERALRPIGVGRENWLFAGADTGAETLSRAMAIIETAKLNGFDPQAYLADDARRKLALWRYDYNNVRPHSSLGNQTPAEARRALEQCEGSAHDALAQTDDEEYETQTRKLSL
ncbi:transposase InsO family protein [Loktanella ponticola]|uniref:Transposase InsO family protein n=1 Tax=Yoonia ponticola TaxID=1524255 RepID=A0A7W9BIB9_9RHOB|nr:transposase InsO family protein [Yoonia ponticola]